MLYRLIDTFGKKSIVVFEMICYLIKIICSNLNSISNGAISIVALIVPFTIYFVIAIIEATIADRVYNNTKSFVAFAIKYILIVLGIYIIIVGGLMLISGTLINSAINSISI